jgi:APA family basic amino acid/polyamine antiporter
MLALMIRTAKGLIQSKLLGYVCPILAILGAFMILYGGLTAANGVIYLIVSGLILVSGLALYQFVVCKKPKNSV